MELFRFIIILFFFLQIVALPSLSVGLERFSHGGRVMGHHYGTTLGLDFNKSYLSLYYDLKKKETDKSGPQKELSLYKNLLIQSLSPEYILTETTYYPLLHFGTYLHESRNDVYQRFNLDQGFNFIRFISDYYEEPWSFSIFFGRLLPFHSNEWEDKSQKQVGMAMTGYSFTYGNRRVKHYYAIYDEWYEIEWKIKGSKEVERTSLKWNFFGGVILHNSNEFYDSIKISLSRFKTDKDVHDFLSFDNASFDYVFQVPIDKENQYIFPRGFFTLQKLVIGKGFPSSRWKKLVFFSHLGVKWQRFKKSTEGRFAHEKDSDFAVFIVPSLSW